jgi:hypothetical protein
MSTPNQELTDILCNAFVAEGVANEKEVASLKAKILAGSVKAGDWKLAVEKSMKPVVEAAKNGG